MLYRYYITNLNGKLNKNIQKKANLEGVLVSDRPSAGNQ